METHSLPLMRSLLSRLTERDRLGSIVVLMVVGAIGAVPAPGDTHDLPRERTILLEVQPRGLEAMVVYQEPPGRRVELLKAQYDLDRDGTLEEAEAVAASASWVPYALQGLEITAAEVELERQTPEVKFRNEHSGALSSAIYLTWRWEERLSEKEMRTIRIQRVEEASSYKTLVRFQTSSPLRFEETPGNTSDETGRIGPFDLVPGTTLEVSVRHPESEDETNDAPSK